MKVMITGANGQVGNALQRLAPRTIMVQAYDRTRLDLTDMEQIRAVIAATTPDLLINAAAYTAVDKAEEEETLAQKINGDAVGVMAAACREFGATLVQLSTDFVFDGHGSRAYRTTDPTAPLSAYGRTKLAGERGAGEDSLIVRTSWVHAAKGHNFVRTMLRLMAEREKLGIVSDQIGSPTFADDLAVGLWRLIEAKATGMHHYTNAGVASWYDFAVAVMEEAVSLGLLDHAIEVTPITSDQFPTAARRPAFSVLEKSQTWSITGAAPHWRDGLRRMLRQVKENG